MPPGSKCSLHTAIINNSYIIGDGKIANLLNAENTVIILFYFM